MTHEQARAIWETLGAYPRETVEYQIVLFTSSKHSMVYNWNLDMYTIKHRNRKLVIGASRLRAFGYSPVHFKIDKRYCKLLIDYIEWYEEFYHVPSSVTYE
jgi:hypothetical protein